MGETVIGPKAAEWLWDCSPTPRGGTSKGIRFLVYSSKIFQAQTQVYVYFSSSSSYPLCQWGA